MRVRFVVAALVLLVGGAAAGYAVATDDDPVAPARTSFDGAEPMSATDPEIPVEIFRQDPDDATLEPGIPLRTALLTRLDLQGRRTKDALSVPVPVGWSESQSRPYRFQFVVPGNDALAFGLRVDILADTGRSVETAMQSRESELRSALLQGSFTDLEITEDISDGFTAQYVTDGYQRFSIERFYPGPDPDQVYAAVSVYGRARDLTGLGDLLENISIGLQPVQQR